MNAGKPNQRTSGNGAVALWCYVQLISRAVPECERSPVIVLCERSEPNWSPVGTP